MLLSDENKDPVHDELLFVIMHQSKELWFSQLIEDLDEARTEIRRHQFAEACMYLVRCRRIFEVLLTSWDVLATLRPREFWRFRRYFGDASGLQSAQFRQVEFTLGLRHHAATVTKRHEDEPARHEALLLELDRPSLWDEVVMALHNHLGFQISDTVGKRTSFSEPYPYPKWSDPAPGEQRTQRRPDVLGDKSVEEAWLTVFGKRERFPSTYRLGETLLDLASALALWRFKHIQTVQRFIGDSIGSGGFGVRYLTDTLKWRVFPELWSVQNRFNEFEARDSAEQARDPDDQWP
jgi:tryptophan 2,3-dioxygenase